MDFGERAIEQAKKLHGKIEVVSKVKVRTREDLSTAYTPGVASVSTLVASNKKLAYDHTIKGNSVAIISDGSAVLGLGNIGPEAALPIMEGKAVLFKRFANIDAFPIVLSTQNTDEIVAAIKAIAPTFGGINLEDISAPRCFEIEERLKKELSIPVMHDDQHGTAIAVLAALINALKVARKEIAKTKIVISGAGAAGIAIANILLRYGAKNIIATDSRGALYFNRPDLNEVKKQLAQFTNVGCINNKHFKCEIGGLEEVIQCADVFIGVSAPGILTSQMVKTMAPKSIVFAMANPIPEIMPAVAKKSGAFIVASGRSDFPNQINNVLVFPGIFRGALDNGVKTITEEMKIAAAKNLAAVIKNPTKNLIIPSVFSKEVVKAVARA